MNIIKAILIGVILGLSLRIFVTLADVQIEHFEDGSGRITYCLPLSDCN